MSRAVTAPLGRPLFGHGRLRKKSIFDGSK
jgi:hypothetical protein